MEIHFAMQALMRAAIWWQCDNEALPNETAYVFEFVHTNTH